MINTFTHLFAAIIKVVVFFFMLFNSSISFICGSNCLFHCNDRINNTCSANPSISSSDSCISIGKQYTPATCSVFHHQTCNCTNKLRTHLLYKLILHCIGHFWLKQVPYSLALYQHQHHYHRNETELQLCWLYHILYYLKHVSQTNVKVRNLNQHGFHLQSWPTWLAELCKSDDDQPYIAHFCTKWIQQMSLV